MVSKNGQYMKPNILPRQTRDKHRENSNKGPFFLRDHLERLQAGAPLQLITTLLLAVLVWCVSI